MARFIKRKELHDMATMKDVAHEAKTSLATVSNYLSGKKIVGKESADRIRAAIEKLHYAPNLSARSLKSNQYAEIGVIMPSFNDPYYVQLFKGIEQILQNSGRFVSLAFSYDMPELEREIANTFLSKNVGGLILITCQPENWKFYYHYFVSKDKAMVLIDRSIPDLVTNFLSFDYYSAIRRIVSDLIQSGKRDIFLFAGPERFYCEKECIRGYVSAFETAGLPVGREKIVRASINKEDAFRHTVSLLRRSCPQVIVATSESTAAGISEALSLLGYRVPRDICVITLSEDHWNVYTHSHTAQSIVRPAILMGSEAASLLLEQLRSPKVFECRRVILPDRKLDATRVKITERRSEASLPFQATIKVLMMQTRQVEALLGLLPHFQNTENINVLYEVLPHAKLFNRILAEQDAGWQGARSDVYMFDIPWLYDLASRNVLADITRYVQSRDCNSEIFFPNCLKYFSEFQKRYYGLPFMYAPQVLYYRKDLFQNPLICAEYEKAYHSRLRAPLAWTEFNAISEFFTFSSNAVAYGTAIPTADNNSLIPEIYARLLSYGGRVFDENNRVVFDSEQALKAYINLVGCLRHAKPNSHQSTDVSVVDDFLRGETAMLITYPSFFPDITDSRRSGLTGNIGYAHIPGKTPVLGGWSFGVSQRSEQKDASFRFINWACASQVTNYFSILGGQPAITSLYTNDELIQLYPWLPLYLDTYRYAKPVAPPVLSGKRVLSDDRIVSIICKWFYEILAGHVEIAQAIHNTQLELEKLRASYQ